jgi:diguanylate cyclase (GGDEF)-like protein
VRRIASVLRNVDVLARYGGEEFLAMLPSTTLEGACILAERVRTAVGNRPLQTGRGDLAVTISVGVGTLAKSDPDVDGLLRRADDALYQAKAQGRDRVVVASLPDGYQQPAPA